MSVQRSSVHQRACSVECHAIAVCLLLAVLLTGCGTSGDKKAASLCPDTPPGIALDPDGCPLYSDADAVPDYRDKCPDTAPGVAVNEQGCPLAGERIAIVTNINFDFNLAKVRENTRKRLSRVIELLKETPQIDVQIVGYTDNIGSPEYNLALSLRRAEAVRDYMVSRGISGARLSVAGRGMADPLVSNSTAQGRAVNRRVEFVVQ